MKNYTHLNTKQAIRIRNILGSDIRQIFFMPDTISKNHLPSGKFAVCIGLMILLYFGWGHPFVAANPINIKSFLNANQIDFFGNVLDSKAGNFEVGVAEGQGTSVVNILDDATFDPFGIDFIGQPAEARAFANDDGTFGGVVHTGLSPGGGSVTGTWGATYLKDSGTATHETRVSNTHLALVDFGGSSTTINAQVDFGIALNGVEVFSDLLKIERVATVGGPAQFRTVDPVHVTVTEDNLFNGISFPGNVLRMVADPFTYALDISSVGVGSTYRVDYSFGIQAIGSESFERLAHAQFWDPVNGGGFQVTTSGVSPVPPAPPPTHPGPGPAPSPVPEPATGLMVSFVLAGLGLWRYRSQRQVESV